MNEDLEKTISIISTKDTQVLCREVRSINDTMDVLRSKWTVELLTAILCGNTRFKDMLSAIHGLSEKVLADRLRLMIQDKLIERQELYGYPPRVEYRLTEHGKQLYSVIYQMTEWGIRHRKLILG